MYVLAIVGCPLVSTVPVLLGHDSHAAAFRYRAALLSLTIGVFRKHGFGALVVARTLELPGAAVPA